MGSLISQNRLSSDTRLSFCHPYFRKRPRHHLRINRLELERCIKAAQIITLCIYQYERFRQLIRGGISTSNCRFGLNFYCVLELICGNAPAQRRVGI